MDELAQARSEFFTRMLNVRVSCHDLSHLMAVRDSNSDAMNRVPEPWEWDAVIDGATHILQELCVLRAMATIYHQMDKS